MAIIVTSITLPIFCHAGPMLCADWPVWWSITEQMRTEIVPQQQWLWGVLWPHGNGGFALGENYSASIIVPWLFSQLFTVTVAQKLTLLLSLHVVAFAGYYVVARTFCLRLIACLAGMLVLLRNIDLINDGMWYNSVAIAIALFFGSALVAFIERQEARHWALAGALLAIVCYCHPLGVVMSFSAWLATFVYTCRYPPESGQLKLRIALCVLPCVSLLLAAPQVLALSGGGMFRPASDFSMRTFRPELSDAARLVLLAIAIPGAVSLRRLNQLAFWIMGVTLIIALVIYLRVIQWLPNEIPLRAGLLEYADRFDHVIDTILLLMCTGTVAWVVSRLSTLPNRLPIVGQATLWTSLLIVVVGLYVAAPRSTLGTLHCASDFDSLVDWLASNVGVNGPRVYFEDTVPGIALDETGTILPVGKNGTHLFGFATGRANIQQVNGFWISDTSFGQLYCSSGGRLLGFPIEKLQEQRARTLLQRLNCRYIVTFSEKANAVLKRFEFLKVAAIFEPFLIFEVREYLPCMAWEGDDPAQILAVVQHSLTEYMLETTNATSSTATVSLAYSSRWKAYAQGTQMNTEPFQGLIRIPLDQNPPEKIVLRYEINRTAASVATLSGAAFYAVAFLALRCLPKRGSKLDPLAPLLRQS